MQENVNIPDSNITANLTFRQLVLMNMQQLTNFPYIEKDFDALTDYELLCLVVKFLNDVIANQNEQNDSITSMYNAFLSLQSYVNNTKDTLEDAFNTLDNYVRNYFDNLDVQDEIDHKLDEYVEDGTLEHIIASYLQTQKIYNTHTEMIADADNLVNGLTVQTLGYYSINDGGGSFYKIVNVEPLGDYYEEVGDLYAILLLSDAIKPEQLGAYGDNTHDDTTVIQNTLNNFKNVKLTKEYLISAITIKNNNVEAYGSKIYGQVNIQNDVFLNGGEFYNDETNGICLNLTSTRENTQGRMSTYIDNVKLYPNETSGIGIKVSTPTNPCFDFHISNSEIFDCYYSIQLDNTRWITKSTFENIYCHTPSIVIKATNSENNPIYLADITFKNVYAQYYQNKPLNFLNLDLGYLKFEESYCYDGIEEYEYYVSNTSSRVTIINDNIHSLYGDKFCNNLDTNILTIPRYNDGSTILKANQAMSQKWITSQYGTIVPMASSSLGVTGAPFLGFVSKGGTFLGSTTNYSMLSFNNGRLLVGYNSAYDIASFKKYEVTTPMAGQVFTSDALPPIADGRRNGATCWCSDLKLALTYYDGHWYKPDGTQFS